MRNGRVWIVKSVTRQPALLMNRNHWMTCVGNWNWPKPQLIRGTGMKWQPLTTRQDMHGSKIGYVIHPITFWRTIKRVTGGAKYQGTLPRSFWTGREALRVSPSSKLMWNPGKGLKYRKWKQPALSTTWRLLKSANNPMCPAHWNLYQHVSKRYLWTNSWRRYWLHGVLPNTVQLQRLRKARQSRQDNPLVTT